MTRVLTPQSGSRGINNAIRSLWRGLPHAGRLGWLFFIRDIRAEHRQSVLGYFWFVVPALANTIVWVFLNRQGVVRIDTGPVPYAVFVLVGTGLWTAINNTVSTVLSVVAGNRGLLAKVNFPHESLVYSAILKSSLDAIVACALVAVAAILFGISLHLSALLFVLAIVSALLLGASVALVCVPFAALYGDVNRALQLLLRFGFFLTPVIFPLPQSGLARTILLINPATPIIVSGRAWLVHSPGSMPWAFLGVTLGAALLGGLGLLIYKLTLPHLVERLSA